MSGMYSRAAPDGCALCWLDRAHLCDLGVDTGNRRVVKLWRSMGVAGEVLARLIVRCSGRGMHREAARELAPGRIARANMA